MRLSTHTYTIVMLLFSSCVYEVVETSELVSFTIVTFSRTIGGMLNWFNTM